MPSSPAKKHTASTGACTATAGAGLARATAGLGILLSATLGSGCVAADATTPPARDDIGLGDVEEIVTSSADACGYSVGFAWPLGPDDPSDWQSHEYYAGRGFLEPGTVGGVSTVHVGADFIASDGDEVYAGVTGELVRYQSSGSGGEGGGYSFVAVIASFISPELSWNNGDGDATPTDAYLTIYGHIRSTSEVSGGTPSGLSQGDCVSPGTLIGWVQQDGYNGDGAEHLHYGVRLQSVEDAQNLPSSYWYEGYETSGSRIWYADPVDPLGATIELEDWAADSVDLLHDAGILAEDSSGYDDRITWNRAEVAHILAGVLELESTDVYGNCACPFDDVDAGADWYADDVCTLTWLEYGDGVTPFRNESGSTIAFNPGQVLTRAQFLKVLLESYDVDKVTSGADFDDVVDAPEDLQVYIHTADDLGLLGHDSDSFRPNDVVTKGEIAVFVARAVDHADLGRPTPDDSDFSEDPNSQCGGGW